MRIVIDLQGAQCGSRHRGIGRYSLALALAMARNRGEHDVFIMLSGLFPESIEPIRAEFDQILPQDNIRVWYAAGPVNAMNPDNTSRRHNAELIREAFLETLKPDIVHLTSVIEGFDDNAVHSIGRFSKFVPTAVTFYDLIPLLQKEVYLTPNPEFEKLYMEKVEYLSRADIFLAISESSRLEAIDYLHVGPEKAVNISAAADDHFKVIEFSLDKKSKLLQSHNLFRPFIMYSGATDERKNHLRLIQAFALLPEEIRNGYQLAIVGSLPPAHRSQFEAHVRVCGLASDDIVITGRVSDADMAGLYNLCELFVFPSWHEGFGLPALEAMSCGAPVIGSNTTSLPEVIGRSDALFDPFDAIAISKKIQEVLGNDQFRRDLKRHGLQQAQKFSWDASAKKAIRAIEDWHAKQMHGRSANVKKILPNLLESLILADVGSVGVSDLITTSQAIAQNHPQTHDKQLLVDISELVQIDSRSGIQRVVRSILLELLTNPPYGYKVEPVYAPAVVGAGYRYARKFTRQFLEMPSDSGIIDSIVEVAVGDIFLGLDLSWIVFHQPDFFSFLREINVKTYFLVYDLLPILNPNLFPGHVPPGHTKWLTAVSQADGVVCISRAVADELLSWLRVFGPKRYRQLNIGWFHLGADVSQSIPTKGLPSDFNVVLSKLSTKPTFLLVGTIEPRKGVMQTMLAFEQLWMQNVDVNLVLVGKQGWNVDALTQMLNNSARNHSLFWLKDVSDEYLEMIYHHATCLIAASEGEGFGLPLIEASQKKLPIIARDIPVFREVAGEHATYFSGHTPDSLANCVKNWLSLKNPPLSDKMPWLTWKQSTEQLVNVVLDEQWYTRWVPDHVLRFWGADPRLMTQVGEPKTQHMQSTGKQGFLIYGPYMHMDAGNYEVIIHGDWNSLSDQVRVEVTCNTGMEKLVDQAFRQAMHSNYRASFQFFLAESCEDLEMRIWVDKDAMMTVSLFELYQIDELTPDKESDHVSSVDVSQKKGFGKRFLEFFQ